jgi:transaldolase
MACDILRPVYDSTGGADGFVSLEASPFLADETPATLEEVRRLGKMVNRPNLMIKIPATAAGIPAIQTLLSEGYNINITLMFSLAHYEAVAKAYINGLGSAKDPKKISSVASFFVSRVDTKIDKALEAIGTPAALALRGKAAVANSKLTYQRFKEIFYGTDFASLRQNGARAQRVLWGSTSTKNPAYSDIKYVESLIGKETVNTMPPETIEAFRDHGKPKCTLDEGLEEAETDLANLKSLGISLEQVTEELQQEGVKAFADSFRKLLEAIEEKRKAFV